MKRSVKCYCDNLLIAKKLGKVAKRLGFEGDDLIPLPPVNKKLYFYLEDIEYGYCHQNSLHETHIYTELGAKELLSILKELPPLKKHNHPHTTIFL